MKQHSGKRRLRRIICIAVVVLIVIPSAMTVAIYESAFGNRYTTAAWAACSVEDFEGLCMERSDFESDGELRAGYKYSKDCDEISGVVIVAHGLGGGGQSGYMPVIDYFASNGFYVFAYDARGNDASEGASAKGFPQGVIDLDSAICHAETIDEYQGLPILLFGHSWGAYSSASVLALHPEIKAAAIVSGCNDSLDLIEYYGERHAGAFGKALLPYFRLYECIKFGRESASVSAIEGMNACDADIIIIHSSDDTTVPTEYGYDLFYAEFSGDERFEFVLFEDHGHGYPFYSDAARSYFEACESGNAEGMEACYDLDEDLMRQILDLYLR